MLINIASLLFVKYNVSHCKRQLLIHLRSSQRQVYMHYISPQWPDFSRVPAKLFITRIALQQLGHAAHVYALRRRGPSIHSPRPGPIHLYHPTTRRVHALNYPPGFVPLVSPWRPIFRGDGACIRCHSDRAHLLPACARTRAAFMGF